MSKYNNIIKKKIDGFTILELIISIILSSIFILFFYWVYIFASKEWSIYEKNQNDITDLLSFINTIERDFDSADVIVFKSNKYILINNNDTIIYTLKDLPIRRSNNYGDTFKIVLSKQTHLFLNNNIDTMIIKSLTFDIDSPIKVDGYVITKLYTSKQLLDNFNLNGSKKN